MENKALFPNSSAPAAESLPEQLADITSKVLRFTSAGGAAIAIVSGDVAVTRASSGNLAPDVDSRLRLDGSFAGLCIQSGELLYCEDADSDPRVDPAASASLGIRSMVMVPVGEKGHVRGVLAAFSPIANGFRPTHIAVMRTLADIVNELAMREEGTRSAPVLEMPVQRPIERHSPVVAPPPIQFTQPEPIKTANSGPGVSAEIERRLDASVEATPSIEIPKSVPVPVIAPEPMVASVMPKVVQPVPEPTPLIKDRFEYPAVAPTPAAETKPTVEVKKPVKDPILAALAHVEEQKKAEKQARENKADVLPSAAAKSETGPVATATTSGAAAKKAPVTNQKPLHVDPVVMPATRSAAHTETPMFRSLEEPATSSSMNMKMIVGALAGVLVVAGASWGVRTMMQNRQQAAPASATPPAQPATAPAGEAGSTGAPATPTAATSTPASTQTAEHTVDASKNGAATNKTARPESEPAAEQKITRQQPVIVASNGSAPRRNAEAVEAPQIALNGKADMGALLTTGKSATPTLSVKRSVLSPPEVIHRVPPKFPDFARRTNPNGDRVVLNVTVGADGKVKQVHLIRGQMVFADSAIAAVKQWQYRPAFLNGDAVESTVEVVISFTGGE